MAGQVAVGSGASGMASPLDLDHAAGDADGSASDIGSDLVEYTLPVGDGSMRAPGGHNESTDAGSRVRPPPNCTVPKPFLPVVADQAEHNSVGGSNMLADGSSGDSRANSRSTAMANPAKPGGGDDGVDGDDEKNHASMHASGGSSSLVAEPFEASSTGSGQLAPKNLKLKPLLVLLVSNAPPSLPSKPQQQTRDVGSNVRHTNVHALTHTRTHAPTHAHTHTH